VQDLAAEIASQLDPSEPLGYRLLLFDGTSPYNNVIFEAKAVQWKGKIAFMTRSVPMMQYGDPFPPLSKLETAFATSDDGLKFLFRNAHSNAQSTPDTVLMPPHQSGHDRALGEHVNLGLAGCYFELGAADSYAERSLNQVVAALSLMQLPAAVQWA
jgi:hypothetical protein